MSANSLRIVAVGALLSLLGGGALISFVMGGGSDRDPMLFFMAAWVLACGVGLWMHKKWAMWALLAGTLVLSAATIFNSLNNGHSVSNSLSFAAIFLGGLGVPFLIVWTRRDRLQPANQESVDA